MGDVTVQAATRLLQALHKTECLQGYLLGVASLVNGIRLLDVYYLPKGVVETTDPTDLAVLLPFGWSVLGCFIKGVTPPSPEDTAATAKQLLGPVQELLPAQTLSIVASGSGNKIEFFEYSPLDGLNRIAKVQKLEDAEALKGLVTFRCCCSLDIQVFSSEGSDNANSIKAAQQVAASKLDIGNLAFMIDRPGSRPTLITPSSTSTAESLSPALADSSTPEILTTKPLLDCTTSDKPPPEFAYDYQPVAMPDCRLQSIRVFLDVLCVVDGSTQLAEVGEGGLLPALQRQLSCAAERLAGLPSIEKVQCMKAFHCQPPGRQHLVTMMYAHLSSDLEAVETEHLSLRQRLHTHLGLPDSRPCLRMAHALPLLATAQAVATGAVQRLRNVHMGLTPPVSGGTVYSVDGNYDYHHYMQDKFNDAGWGCAYRSLQTICSWFRAQHYTSKPVPSHREIQEILVKIGDKDSTFVGSCNWIGAIELSYILDEYLGITSKIVTVNRGEDIPMRVRELAQHFVNQGTPVMIGGGVLAYTLLGVQLHEQTGECAFLILDPHYTGGEDLQKIQQGTWVGWKKYGDFAAAGGSLFVPDAFYNFLCPQRPKLV